MGYFDESWDDDLDLDEDYEIIPKKEKAKKVEKQPPSQLRVQCDGRFFVKGEDCYFKTVQGKEYLVQGDCTRYKKQVGHELMITGIVFNPTKKNAEIKILSFI